MTADERADTAGRVAPGGGRQALFLSREAFSSLAVGVLALGLLVFAVVMTTVRPGHHPPRLKPVTGQAPNPGIGFQGRYP